jgi:hypothetical protein
MRKTLSIIVIVAALLVLDGLVYGLWTNRWRSPEALLTATARLEQIPMVIGDWQGQPGKALEDREVQLAGFSGYVARSYHHRINGNSFTVLLACGPAGPLSVHSPEICYGGAGYEALKETGKRTEPAIEAELWQARFGKPESTASGELRVLWTWNVAGAWMAPDNARFAFAGAPVVYKLYVVQQTTQGDESSDRACSEFLEKLLPELNRRLFPAS